MTAESFDIMVDTWTDAIMGIGAGADDWSAYDHLDEGDGFLRNFLVEAERVQSGELEYRRVVMPDHVTGDTLPDWIDEQGRDGWELVNLGHRHRGGSTFKREVSAAERRE